jgi:transposase-like protein
MHHHAETDERDFRPPFCPQTECDFHHRRFGWPWVRDGFHRRKAAPQRIQRFRCLSCGRSFSTQTSRTTYWLKRPDLQQPIFRQVGACSGYRQTADVLGCVHSTVLNQTRRLGQHCLLFQHLRAPPGPPSEPLVLDGLRTYELSQYWPCDLNHVTGAKTHFIEGFNVAPLRRSGTMTPRQKKKRERLEKAQGRPDPQATRKQVEALLRRVTGGACAVDLVSDEHGAYVQAVKRMKGWRVKHLRISSKAPRSPKNPLWTANLLDLLVRHGGSNHKRETIAASKRAQSALLRMAVFQVTRNFIRGVRVRDGKKSPSPAMKRGLTKRRLEVEDVLQKRLFPSHVDLPPDLQEVYAERVPTRQLGEVRQHELTYAW